MTGLVKKFIFICLLGCVIVLVIGYVIWNKPHADVQDATGIGADAAALYHTFITDPQKARSIYLNKIVRVSGIVRELSQNQQRQQVILLNTGVAGASINCTMERSTSRIRPGDSATIKGICGGYMDGDSSVGIPGDVLLLRCYSLK